MRRSSCGTAGLEALGGAAGAALAGLWACIFRSASLCAQGRYVFKLLAVDVPSVTGGQQRLFLEGGPAVYGRSGVLNELREPFLRALGMQETWDAEDEADALDEVQRTQQEQRAAERERALQAGVPEPPARRGGLAAGGLYERTLLAARQLLPWLGQRARQPGG